MDGYEDHKCIYIVYYITTHANKVGEAECDDIGRIKHVYVCILCSQDKPLAEGPPVSPFGSAYQT